MTLAEAVRSALAEPLRLPHPLPSEPMMARAAARVAARMEQVGELTPFALADLRRRLEREPNLRSLGPREFKHVAHLLWDPPQFAAKPDFVLDYLGELRRRASGPSMRRLALLWLLHFSAEAPAIKEIAALLETEAHRLRGALAQPEVARRVFDPVSGPSALARELTNGQGAPDDVLERHGLKGPTAQGGYVLAAFVELLGHLAQAMAAQRATYLPLLRRVLDFARDADRKPRFEPARATLAETLLRPFAACDPPAEIRELIESELLERLGDPRVASNRWAGVNEAAREVMFRWLAEATLEAFLAIVRRHADPDHWRFREAFWRAYLRAGHIRWVQVAFRSQAAEEARRMAHRDRRLLAFAELSGYGTLANHAVLLLRIGDLTLAEWSHSGALRIWRAGHPNAPRLTGRHFDGSELKAEADLRVIHHPQGPWQDKVAEYVWRETGLRVARSEYMPRR